MNSRHCRLKMCRLHESTTLITRESFPPAAEVKKIVLRSYSYAPGNRTGNVTALGQIWAVNSFIDHCPLAPRDIGGAGICVAHHCRSQRIEMPSQGEMRGRTWDQTFCIRCTWPEALASQSQRFPNRIVGWINTQFVCDSAPTTG